MNKKVFFIFPLLAFFFFALEASAATISLFPESRNFVVGQEFSVDIKINTEEVFINASQATIRFPAGVLELTQVDKTGSAFGFWTDEPKISNEEGTMSFTGGAGKGISGASLQILKMKFRAKAAGAADLAILDAAVTAPDGKGTNVLSKLNGANINISSVQLPNTGTVVAPPPPAEVVKIVRQPVPAQKLPQKPELRVPLYPDQTQWHNNLGDTAVLWNVPEDVIEVAAALDKNPNTIPANPEKELLTGKSFGILKEGVWYIHVRFRNNVGWGETAHYRIAIDTTVPTPFEVKMDQLVSDNPSPEIRYEAHDALSGISNNIIFLDGKEFLKSTTTSTILPPQPPGKHALLVRIFDLAGNSVEADLKFEILPLPMPIIEFVTRSVSQDDLLFASGKSIPNSFIDARAFNASQEEVFKGTSQSDASGNWKISIEKALPTGQYFLSVIARDDRGATSYPAKQELFSVRAKIILSLGGFINLGWFEIFIIAMLVIISGSSFISWRYASKNKMHQAYGIIAGRDVEKMAALLEGDLAELEKLLSIGARPEFPEKAGSLHLFAKLHETIAKMKKYLGEEVGKIK